jgi:hypothetical protein
MESTNRPPLGECRRARKNSNAFLGNINLEHLLHLDIGYRCPFDDDSFIANLSKKANTIKKFLLVEFQSSWHACVSCVSCVMFLLAMNPEPAGHRAVCAESLLFSVGGWRLAVIAVGSGTTTTHER